MTSQKTSLIPDGFAHSHYSAKSLKTHNNDQVYRGFQWSNLLLASFSSKFIVKSLLNPLYRVQTLVQCQSETFTHRQLTMTAKEVSNSYLNRRSQRTSNYWIFPRYFDKFFSFESF